MAQRQFFMGVDIGGTFTDLVLFQDGRQQPINAKTLTTPADPVNGVMNAVRDAMAQANALPHEIRRVVHATTLATNLILERKGARLGYVTTQGFGDMFHISKQYPSGIDRFNALYDRPEPLVEREMVIEIRERLNFRGEVLTPLDEAQAESAIKKLAAARPEAVAVCLLHSYANPAHERKIGEMLQRRMPGVYIALSSEVWPEFQEYERASTTLISAYVGPMLAEYLGRLEEQLRKAGIGCGLQIMQSSGGGDARVDCGAQGRIQRRVGTGGGSYRNRATGVGDRPRQPDLIRYGRHHGQGRTDPAWQAQHHARFPRRHRSQCRSQGHGGANQDSRD